MNRPERDGEMIESIGTAASGNVGVVKTAAASSSASASSGSGSGVVSEPISPRMMEDPVAGVVIAQYLSSDGNIASQFPSSTVVAYLRSGLSATGLPIHDQAASVQSEV